MNARLDPVFITDSGMADEGSGKHLYDIGQRFESALAANFVNKVSKVHDFFNSWNYNEVGKFVSRGEGFDTIFQLFSFAGMPVAARVTADMLWQNPLQSKR